LSLSYRIKDKIKKGDVIKKLLLTLLALSSILFAKNGWYGGVDVVNGNGKETSSNESYFKSDSYNLRGIVLKLGYVFDEGFLSNENRIEFDFNNLNIDIDHYMGLEAKYLFSQEFNKIKFFAGPSIGSYFSSEKKGININNNEEKNARALSLGFSLGIYYEIISYVELEISYEYNYLEWNYVDLDLNDKLNIFCAGINFKF
jgi:opacity protein-like surface antigen